MKCLNCGKEVDNLLCNDCVNVEILREIFFNLSYYKEDRCENEYIKEFAQSFDDVKVMQTVIPDVLNLFDTYEVEYYWCKYYGNIKDDSFEDRAIAYIEKHDIKEELPQRLLRDLLKYYIPDDLIKPGRWCDMVRNKDGLCYELYEDVATYYSYIGDYDIAESIVDKMKKYCDDESYEGFLYCDRVRAVEKADKLYGNIDRYRNKKPYWPVTEERRRMVAKFYDDRGITYPRIDLKPEKISESDFKPMKDCLASSLDSYSAFWCECCYAYKGVKAIYQIAAVKVKNGKIMDKFESYIRTWDGVKARKAAAKQAGVSEDYLNACEDVDQVMKKFFEFVGDDVLVSTGASGEQSKLVARATRYAGMSEIKNEFFDLLDMAADASAEFDLNNNTRDYLLKAFSINEGKNALEKAEINMKIYDKLESYGE